MLARISDQLMTITAVALWAMIPLGCQWGAPPGDGGLETAEPGPSETGDSDGATDGVQLEDGEPDSSAQGPSPMPYVYLTPDGDPVHWMSTEVQLLLDPGGPEGLASEDLLQAFELGVQPWNQLECPIPQLTVETVESCPGEVAEDGLNCVVWIQKPELWRWPSHLVAITLVHYFGDSGLITDADLEFNGATNTWSVSAECNGEDHDLWATVTHEAGHVLGLDHNSHPQATMNAVTFPGDCKKRTLHDVDVDAVCGLYEGFILGEDDTPDAGPDSGTIHPVGDLGDGDVPYQDGGGDERSCQGAGGGGSLVWLTGCALVAIYKRRRGPGPVRAR